MSTSPAALPVGSALVTRLSGLAPLSMDDLDRLCVAERQQRGFPARREIVAEGSRVREQRALLSGWACHQRILRDGRRQIIDFLLPGDLIGMDRHRDPIAPSSILAITEVVTCTLPKAEPNGSLAEAYAQSVAADERRLFAQITRLGRLDARERIIDWLLETHDRLNMAGVAQSADFSFPLTQDLVADALGLTSVHVNRMLQSMRRDGILTLQGGRVRLPDLDHLRQLVHYRAPRAGVR